MIHSSVFVYLYQIKSLVSSIYSPSINYVASYTYNFMNNTYMHTCIGHGIKDLMIIT